MQNLVDSNKLWIHRGIRCNVSNNRLLIQVHLICYWPHSCCDYHNDIYTRQWNNGYYAAKYIKRTYQDDHLNIVERDDITSAFLVQILINDRIPLHT